MTNIIPRKDFAEQCGISNNILPIHVSRGKIILNGTRCSVCSEKPKPCRECSKREYIDLDYRNSDGHYINMDFYKKYAKKEDVPKPVKHIVVKENKKEPPTFIKPVMIEKKMDPDKELNFGDLSEDSSDDRLTRAKKFREIQNKEAATRLLELQEAKIRGEMIPLSMVEDVVQIMAESNKRAYADAGENLIMLISERLGAQEHDKAFMRTKLLDTMNKAIDNGVNAAQTKIRETGEDEGV